MKTQTLREILNVGSGSKIGCVNAKKKEHGAHLTLKLQTSEWTDSFLGYVG
jgi:hypothetical protein